MRAISVVMFRLLALLVLAVFLGRSEPTGPQVEGLVTIPVPTRDVQWPKMRPSVFMALMCRNKAHSMKNFLGYLEELDYPKDRMTIW